MSSSLDELLQRVAAGELSPEEALRLIDGDPAEPGPTAAHTAQAPSAPTFGTTPASAPGGEDVLHEPGSGRGLDDDPAAEPARDRTGSGNGTDGRIRGVRLLAAYRQVTVVADPTVAHAHVSGRHTVRQEGDVLVVEGGWNPLGPFGARGDGDEGGLRFAFTALPRSLAWATTAWPGEELTVRVNPEIRLEVDATGANLRISGPEAGARVRLLASSLKVDRLRGPLDLDARTSSVKGTLGPTGQSRISTEQSSVKVSLLAGSGLRITATNRMGKVLLPGQVSKDGGFGETLQAQVGHGGATLTLDAVMSSVMITTEDRVRSR